MTIAEVVDSTPLVDNHAHAVEPQSAETIREAFSTFFTEGELSPRHARHTLNYRAALSLLRTHFDADDEAELLRRRSAVDLESYSRELIGQTGTEVILADDGFPDLSPMEFEAYTDADVRPILRIEPVVEDLVDAHDTFADVVDEFETTVTEALAGDYVALKSIVAYRTGLDVGAPDRSDARTAFDTLEDGWDGRLESKPLVDFFLHRACALAGAADAPVQLHTGFGDADAHPHFVDPTYLYDLLRTHRETPVVLLHASYPYVRQAGYVTSTFEEAYLDISLALPFVQNGVEPLLRQVFEVTPTSKVMYGSDAFCIPELYVLAADRIRADLTTVLEDLVVDGFLDERYAETVARNVLRENAHSLYDL
ncbi:amidohydrolase family protein [Salinigranum sp.]|uniref:amidohydrolase family protein n=1 Tax=Salinigranum sp. TaxID=1966351 RepID=UPI00356362C3